VKILSADGSITLACDFCNTQGSVGVTAEFTHRPDPEVGFKTWFHICASCYEDRVLPWLVGQGVQPGFMYVETQREAGALRVIGASSEVAR